MRPTGWCGSHTNTRGPASAEQRDRPRDREGQVLGQPCRHRAQQAQSPPAAAGRRRRRVSRRSERREVHEDHERVQDRVRPGISRISSGPGCCWTTGQGKATLYINVPGWNHGVERGAAEDARHRGILGPRADKGCDPDGSANSFSLSFSINGQERPRWFLWVALVVLLIAAQALLLTLTLHYRSTRAQEDVEAGARQRRGAAQDARCRSAPGAEPARTRRGACAGAARAA